MSVEIILKSLKNLIFVKFPNAFAYTISLRSDLLNYSETKTAKV